MSFNRFGGFNFQGMDEETAMQIALALSMQGQQGSMPFTFGPPKPKDPRDVGAVGMESVLKREHKQTGKILQVRKGDMTKGIFIFFFNICV